MMSSSKNTVESILFVDDNIENETDPQPIEEKYAELVQRHHELERQLEDVLWENSHTINTLTVAQNEARRVTEELRATRQFYQALFDHAYDPTIVISTDGTVQSSNAALQRVLGYQPHEVIGKNVSVLMDEPDASDHDGHLKRYLNTGEKRIIGIDREVTARHKDGSHIPVRLAVTEVLSPTGDRNFVGSLSDLTDSKQVEARLRNAQKLESIGQLAAGIAHEINTPTQFIGDNVEFVINAMVELERLFVVAAKSTSSCTDIEKNSLNLQRELAQVTDEIDLSFFREEIPGALHQAQEGIKRIASIVSAMKDFSHPGSDHKEVIDLNRAISSTITVARSEWKYVAEVSTSFDSSLPGVPCFPAEINQVILNMIVNAAHAIEEKQNVDHSDLKGEISISTSRTDDHAIICVKDNGIGIPEDKLDRVFDQFYTTKEVGKGTGQGLAIAYASIVEKHRGSISVESEQGHGAYFTVSLPLLHTPL